jgi:hypothetical protein
MVSMPFVHGAADLDSIGARIPINGAIGGGGVQKPKSVVGSSQRGKSHELGNREIDDVDRDSLTDTWRRALIRATEERH